LTLAVVSQNHKFQITNLKQITMTKIQNSKWDVIGFVLASVKYTILLSSKWFSLIRPVSVIDYCDLEFICYLVLVIWNLNHTDFTL